MHVACKLTQYNERFLKKIGWESFVNDSYENLIFNIMDLC